MANNHRHIAFCVNDAYVEYITPSILSIVKNNDPDSLCIHVLSDFVSERNKLRLFETVKEYESLLLQIHIVDGSVLSGLKETWTIYTWFRVLLPDVLAPNIHRVLYLDADVLVVDKLDKLFQLDLTNTAIAGTIDLHTKDSATFLRCGYEPEKEYICAGVLLMNLDYWRENNIAHRIIQWGRNNNAKSVFPDQDAINYVCRDSKYLLPLKYDIVDGFFHDLYFLQNYPQEIRECLDAPVVIHYAGQAPWKREWANHFYQKEWEKYNRMLRHPAKRHYLTSGWPLVKMLAWNLLHAKERRKKHISKDIIISRINAVTQNDS